ncbi:MAG: hypothetical protein ABW195_02935 [Ilumatobacteraceae bacterium]
MPEPTDTAMWRSVEETVRDVLLPALTDDWARVTAIQLVGMARFAATRPPDPTSARVAELTEALDRLGGNPVVAPHWPVSSASPESTFAAVGAVLAGAVVRDDAAGDAVRAELRSVVSRHLDEDLAVSGMLMPYFRGQLPDA